MASSAKPNPKGFLLYHGPSLLGGGEVVAVVTLSSRNGKTGPMAQVWILPAHADPLDAVQANDNQAACGTCALQGRYDAALGKLVDRVCYVNLGQAPKAIWAAYQRGVYPAYSAKEHERFLAGRDIRLGAYGDPAALPTELVAYLASVGTGWTGYSHQLFWIQPERAAVLAKYLMVSCHNLAQHAEADRRGWRAFTAVAHADQAPANAVQCPYYSRGTTCQKCQLCQGTSKAARHVYVIAHGKVGLNLASVPQTSL